MTYKDSTGDQPPPSGSTGSVDDQPPPTDTPGNESTTDTIWGDQPPPVDIGGDQPPPGEDEGIRGW